ncbi:hypothetical protein NDU88_003783 [Pleurodeles waltl]|uniref:Uncharacterized protein n=1 Tax=Pleurodeles waltl TaxID=8319 RepID=A0AAV7UF23_PLEWA|nr:hypothetical protein NDU88_003783 [Pleurodeles waltl]
MLQSHLWPGFGCRHLRTVLITGGSSVPVFPNSPSSTRPWSSIPLNVPVLVPVSGGGLRVLPGLAAAGNPTHRSRLSLTRSSQDFAPHPLLSIPSEFADVLLRIVALTVGGLLRPSMDGGGVLTSTGPSYPLSRGPQLQRVHCSVAAAILDRGSSKVVGAFSGVVDRDIDGETLINEENYDDRANVDGLTGGIRDEGEAMGEATMNAVDEDVIDTIVDEEDNAIEM